MVSSVSSVKVSPSVSSPRWYPWNATSPSSSIKGNGSSSTVMVRRCEWLICTPSAGDIGTLGSFEREKYLGVQLSDPIQSYTFHIAASTGKRLVTIPRLVCLTLTSRKLPSSSASGKTRFERDRRNLSNWAPSSCALTISLLIASFAWSCLSEAATSRASLLRYSSLSFDVPMSCDEPFPPSEASREGIIARSKSFSSPESYGSFSLDNRYNRGLVKPVAALYRSAVKGSNSPSTLTSVTPQPLKSPRDKSISSCDPSGLTPSGKNNSFAIPKHSSALATLGMSTTLVPPPLPFFFCLNVSVLVHQCFQPNSNLTAVLAIFFSFFSNDSRPWLLLEALWWPSMLFSLSTASCRFFCSTVVFDFLSQNARIRSRSPIALTPNSSSCLSDIIKTDDLSIWSTEKNIIRQVLLFLF